MAALTTQFTQAPWCSDRFVVYVDDQAPGTSIIPPSSGWVDPSFTKCIPTQYTTPYPTFSAGICPAHMEVVRYALGTGDHKNRTVWTAECCQRGFSALDDYLCVSTMTDSMSFLMDPNISTADVYTTLHPDRQLYIEHDKVVVQWEASDLKLFPEHIASTYAAMMGLPPPLPRLTSSASVITTIAPVVEAGVTTSNGDDDGETSSSRKTSVFWPTGKQTKTSHATTDSDSHETITTTPEHRPDPSETDEPSSTSGAGRCFGSSVSVSASVTVLTVFLGVTSILMA